MLRRFSPSLLRQANISKEIQGHRVELCSQARPKPEAAPLDDKWSDDDDQFQYDGPPPDPPSPFLGIAALALGAMGAVGIAAVGVYSSFHFATWAVATNCKQKETPERVEPSESE
ncbi:hypothetical protein BSKO_00631 [Bryopsis sp. KO-2023]|nr:hypothetical protein BSKO_00631 [Bryopsis sp. KO-2023]